VNDTVDGQLSSGLDMERRLAEELGQTRPRDPADWERKLCNHRPTYGK